MKLGILTHYQVANMGAQLQLLALTRHLQAQGHDVSVLTYEKDFSLDPAEKTKNQVSIRSIPYYLRHYLLEKGIGLTWFNVRKVRTLTKGRQQFSYLPYDQSGCDAAIIGSDEVFSIDVGCNRMMYGHGLGSMPAVAYAPAFGRTTRQILQQFGCEQIVAEGLSQLRALSARDVHTRSLIRELTGREVPLVCDPVLLYRGDLSEPIRPIRRPYLLVYAYDRNMIAPEEVAAIRAYAKAHGLLTVSVGTYHKWCDRNLVCTAGQWYAYFRDAACVVTDTFHGSVVALRQHCNVAVMVREGLNTQKLTSLLAQTGTADRRLAAIRTEELERVLGTPVDYAAVDAKIAEMAAQSGTWLRAALEDLHG